MKRSLQQGVLFSGLLICVPTHGTQFSGFTGLGVSTRPIYSGSSHMAVGTLLKAGVNLHSENWGLLGLSTDGLIWGLTPDSPFSVSLLLTQDEARKEVFNYLFSGRKNRDLQGMGNLSAALLAGTDLRYQQENWTLWLRLLTATEKQRYGGEAPDRSLIVTSGAEAELWRGQNVSLSVGGDISWANSGYQQRHYGVTEQQAQRTNFAVYSPSSGFQQGGLYAEVVWHFDKNLSAGLSSRAQYLFDEAGSSPLVNSRMQYTLSSLIQYTF
ncbi:structural protein MipA [Enterobacter kobei]|uniref:MipA/OmpV family protein n=1 Tax=Enterobacter kobei TaxID=208224 RepID=UPI0007B34289|nr:MipA/OmpV family protein [Enterobacter kobei]KZQ03891.1 structural protein MipA [Enterobacter kobei]